MRIPGRDGVHDADHAPRAGQFRVRRFGIEHGDRLVRERQHLLAPVTRFGAGQAHAHPGQLGRGHDASIPGLLRTRLDFGQPLATFRKVTQMQQDVGQIEQQGQPCRVVLAEHRRSTPQQVRRRVDVASRRCPGTRPAEALGPIRSDRQAVLVQRPEFAQIAMRLLEVVAQDGLELHRPVAVGVDLVGPAHEVDVQRCARALEQPVVDRVAHQLVVEAVDGFGGAAACRVDEMFARQGAQVFAHGRAQGLRRERLQRGLGELHADHRCRLDGDAFLAAQLVQPGFQQRMDGRRHGDVAVAFATFPTPIHLAQHVGIEQHGQHLLDEQRVAFGGLDDANNHVFGQAGRAQQVLHHLCRCGCTQGPQAQARCAGAFAPLRALFQKLVACSGEHHDGCGAGRIEHMLDQVEEGRFGPMDVVEERNHGCARSQTRQELARRPVHLVQRKRRCAQAYRRGQTLGHIVVARAGQKLGARLLGCVVFENARRVADDAAQGPERDAVAVGKASTLEHTRTAAAAFDKLTQQARLAGPGVTEHRHEPGLRAFASLAVGHLQLRQFVVAAHQRRVVAAQVAFQPQRSHQAVGREAL